MSGVCSNRESAATNAVANSCQSPEWFAQMGRDIWAFKVAAHLHWRTGRSERTCRAWASGDSEPPASVLVTLLRTDDGALILQWVMGDSQIAWWQVRRRDRQVTELFDRQRAEAKRLGLG